MGLPTITDFASSRRGKWVTVLVWIVLAAIVVPFAPRLEEVRSNEDSIFLPSDAESSTAADLASERYPNSGTPAIIVLRNDDGLTEDDFDAARQINDYLVSGEAGDNVNGVVSIFTVPQAEAELVSSDDTTLTIIANVTGSAGEQPYADTIERIRDESKRFDLEEATRRALTRTGGVITSAGLILAGTFSALMSLPLQDLFQLGFAVAIGVLMDTFIIRTLMVPSIVKLLGRWNWWPSRAFRQPGPALSQGATAGDD